MSTDIPDVSRDEFEDDFTAEFRDEIEPDLAPGKAKPEKVQPAKPKPRPVTAAARKRVADELEAYVKMAALTWSLRDEHCAPVLSDQSRAIADSLATILGRNPALLQWVEHTGMIGDWVKLWMAISPVVSAIREHHITKTVKSDDGGAGVDYTQYAAYRPHS